MESGLYERLVSEGFLIPHEESDARGTKEAWKVIKPAQVPFISYYYEWPFGMLKDAALTTLAIQKRALEYGMSLKDSSAFNIQFVKGKPVLIDTLSFERYQEGKPWIAYEQFVENFLIPLYLMAKVDVRLGRLMSVFMNGVPLEVGAAMLPFKTRFDLSLAIHVFAHANAQKKYSDKKLSAQTKSKRFTKNALRGLIDNLEGAVKRAKWEPVGTQWADYYEEDKNNYKNESFRHKMELVEKFLKKAGAKKVWDIGANTGIFSKIAADMGADTLSFDIDYGAIERNYQELVKKDGNEKILPLFLDLATPTPAVGWENVERQSVWQRGPADVVMGLAVIHHLAITFKAPFSYQAQAFSKMGKYLIVEFVDKTDSQVQLLVTNRDDILDYYTKKNFEEAYSEFFKIIEQVPIKGSKRTLYLMSTKNA
jgi:cyclopropane fatty-acyl-phospholipid synthase-like methyltransferase